MSGLTRSAAAEELEVLWPAVAEARLFPSLTSFRSWREEGPWRVRVTDAGLAMIVSRWREHMAFLAVLGLWCAPRHAAAMMDEAVRIARSEGFGRVLGPLVPAESVSPYLEAGFEPGERLVVCRLPIKSARSGGISEHAHLRTGGPADQDQVLALDARCFEDFWRYDRPTLRALMVSGDLVIAERNGEVIGYTLGIVQGAEGTVARLAVDPAWRRHGVGSALLRESVARLAAGGVRAVTLSTQEGNEASRRLYGREGFRESPGRLEYTVSPPLEAEGRAGKE